MMKTQTPTRRRRRWRLLLFLPFLLILIRLCTASVQLHTTLHPPFHRSEMDWVDNNGQFLVSPNSNFALGFQPTPTDVTQFLLVVIHIASSTIVWTANPHTPIQNSDPLVFTEKGKVTLESGSTGTVIWSPNTTGPVSSIQMRETGNLVMLGGGSDNNATTRVLWESFAHPTDTVLSNQPLTSRTRLITNSSSNLITYTLAISNGDVVLSAGFRTPQPYWSMSTDPRRNINKNGGGGITKAVIKDNSWNFYGDGDVLLWTFTISTDTTNSTWIGVLGNDGAISFRTLRSSGGSTPPSSEVRIPAEVCGTPEHCEPFNSCSSTTCSCPSGLLSRGCKTGLDDDNSAARSRLCSGKKKKDDVKEETELVYAGDDLNYVALGYVDPYAKSVGLVKCKEFCANNCSCLAAFFGNSTGECYLFDDLGSFKSDSGSDYQAYVKVTTKSSSSSSSSSGNGGGQQHTVVVGVISVVTVVVVLVMVGFVWRYMLRTTTTRRKRKGGGEGEGNSDLEEVSSAEDDNFLETFSGMMMPVRFGYKDLQSATNGFTDKLGQGGFGSVYKGVLKDGTSIAVKKLEGIGQGKKEFRAEVSIIGSIHHVHLVRLRGFCAQGSHRLLVYELMPKGSLDKWIFHRSSSPSPSTTTTSFLLDWPTRYNIAVGTAKGLAYLHEDCDSKIVHCDIKPENVLLDDNFQAKVSDFGLAKLMTREQSHVFTTLRGTRGYLAPEWITNYAISEKSDVYSYGMVLLEIIGGRKNYDPRMSSEKSHFPSYAFKMMEEGRLNDVVDSSMLHLHYDDHDPKRGDDGASSVLTALKVALWCIQEDMAMRPSMTKVVQMLEGIISPVPDPPTSSLAGSRLFASFYKTISEDDDSGTTRTGSSTTGPGPGAGGVSSGMSDCNSDTLISAVRLSGPR